MTLTPSDPKRRKARREHVLRVPTLIIDCKRSGLECKVQGNREDWLDPCERPDNALCPESTGNTYVRFRSEIVQTPRSVFDKNDDPQTKDWM
jgi:hypothetical protein